MKKKPANIEDIKKMILNLKGQEVKLYINRGRRKVCTYRARVEDVYPGVFTVRGGFDNIEALNTYSYNDILCGDVKINND